MERMRRAKTHFEQIPLKLVEKLLKSKAKRKKTSPRNRVLRRRSGQDKT